MSTATARPLPACWYHPITGRMHIMAPMVGQSDPPFRQLVRRHHCTVVFSEMLLADRFADDAEYREQAFGSHIDDHPLVVQFAANEPVVFARAALCAQAMGADAVDLNLGCPQDRARLGHYGSFLTDPCDWQLCADIIAAAVAAVSIPVTVKIRLQPTVEATITFALMLKNAGASLITVHGRQRGSENNRRDGSADLEAVALVVKALHPLPVASSYNYGNVRCEQDIIDNLRSVDAAGIMIAEQILRDPAVFARAVALQSDQSKSVPEISRYQAVMSLAHEYIDLIQQLDTSFRLDGEAVGHDGARARCSGGGGRLSNWWSNAAVVKNHLLAMFGKQNKLLARSTFRNAVDADAVIAFFKRRFADKKSVNSAETTEEESDVGAFLETLLISS